MLSCNEWDQLQSVIVGRADGARIPPIDRSLHAVNYADRPDVSDVPIGTYPDTVISEANEDLEIFCDVLRSFDIKVFRPAADHCPKYYNYCPRDSILIHQDLVMITPTPVRSRRRDFESMQEIISDTVRHHRTRYHDMTRDFPDEFYNLGDPSELALKDTFAAFDAANILRANNDIFYLVSNTGNLAGARSLQTMVRPGVRVWPIQGIYSYSHIDSTIALLREGLMLLNPDRIKSSEQLPKPLQNWDVIWAPAPVDIGHWPGYEMASTWISMNLFSINPNLVVLERHQTELRDVLEQHGIDCIMLPGRHQRTMSGGFHCVTLDLERA